MINFNTKETGRELRKIGKNNGNTCLPFCVDPRFVVRESYRREEMDNGYDIQYSRLPRELCCEI